MDRIGPTPWATRTLATAQTPTAAVADGGSLYLPRHLAYARIEGGTIVLDLRSGEFLLLDEVASAFWHVLLEAGRSRTDQQHALLARFDADLDQIAADLDVFRQDCLAKGLLADAVPDRPVPVTVTTSRVLLPVWTAWRALVTVAATLRRSGFAHTFSAVFTEAAGCKVPASGGDLPRAERVFARAENFFVSRTAPDDCLPRSLALFRFLRTMGLPATHSIGVDRYSLSAHAWVECDGRVILDTDRRDTLIPLTMAPL